MFIQKMADHSYGDQNLMPEVLENSLSYLIGAIDRVEDQGKGWRRELIGKCKNNGLKIKFLDPTNKIAKLTKEVDEEQDAIREMKKNRKWEDLTHFMKRVVRCDHRSVDLADFVICYLDTDVHMCGSYFELQSVLTQKKPYFIIIKGGKEKTPNWLFGILDHNSIFSSVDEVVASLIEINNGEQLLDSRWVLIRKEIENL